MTAKGGGEPIAWQHFDHDADIGVRGLGATRDAAFENAARALTAVVTPPERVQEWHSIDVTCSAPDDELLLVEWLNALIYQMAVRGMLFSRFRVRIEGSVLSGRAWGEPVDPLRHEPAVEVKGATLTCLRVAQEADESWLAQCVVDV